MNSTEYVETYYAAAKIGATFVPLNYRAKHEELTYMINTSDISVLFAGERYRLVASLRPELTGVEHFACYDRGRRHGVLPGDAGGGERRRAIR